VDILEEQLWIEEVMEMAIEDDGSGVCLECNATASEWTEPDAENLECDSCGAMAMCGAETYLMLRVA